MTKEELKQEAEEYAEERCKDCYMCSADGKRNKCHFYTKRVEAYLASAEPREKRIAELEKSCDETQELLDKQIEATYKLDKENAELKKEVEDSNEKVVHLSCNQNKDLKYKLTKAKEIINTFLGFAEAFGYSPSMNKFITEAEQFISSEVEK